MDKDFRPFRRVTDGITQDIVKLVLMRVEAVLRRDKRAGDPGSHSHTFLSQKDFVAAASHELKSPLAVIMANVENLQNKEITEPQTQNHLNAIDAECMRMSRLVRDMLLLASSDADKWTVQIQEVNIDTLLITLYEAYEPLCRKKAIHLDLNLGAESYP